jgi:putative transposase
MNIFPHRSNLRKGRASVSGVGYFISKCILHKDKILLNDPEIAKIVIKTFQWMISNKYIKIDGFIIMPDHYHIIMAVSGTKSLSNTMRSINQYSAKKINTHLHRSGRFWEEGFFDHALRNLQDYEMAIKYLHDNPVKTGLCSSPDEYLFSSVNKQYNNIVDWDWFL